MKLMLKRCSRSFKNKKKSAMETLHSVKYHLSPNRSPKFYLVYNIFCF